MRNSKEAIDRSDRLIIALQKKGKKHAGNWLLSKRGYVTCDPHRMPLTIEERTNLQRSTPTREGTVRFAKQN